MELDTLQAEWRLLRAAANEDASLINLTTAGDFARKPASAKEIKSNEFGLGSMVNDLFIAIAAGAAADKNLTWRLYAWAKFNGMAQQAAYGTAKTGTQAVVKYPDGQTATNIFWCDTIVVTAFSWPKTIKATPGAGNNSVGLISLDALGWPWWKLQVEDADGSTGDEAGAVSAWWKRK